jgi:hypothetical protein
MDNTGAEPPHKGVLVADMQTAELLERHSLAGQYSRSCGLASTVRADAARELTYNKQYSGAAQRRIVRQTFWV